MTLPRIGCITIGGTPNIRKAVELTSREKQIMGFVSQGYTYKEVALELGISNNTTRNTIVKLLDKIEANNSAHAVYICMKNHWLDI